MQTRSALAVLALAAACGNTLAWDPANGDWLKSDATDLRVMTWNVQDAICRTEDKANSSGSSWNAIARVVATIQPDVLIMQETGDNSGNGTGGGVDSVSALETVLGLFLHGGADPYNGGTVGSYVQLYVPDYDLPYIYVSPNSDGFNRNVILSRYPFADITGNGDSVYSTVATRPDAWQSGGNAGIRGWALAEIDLPDAIYAGDAVVGCSHLKAGGSSSDASDRIDAAKVMSYVIQYFFNGNQTGVPNPTGNVSVPRTTESTTVLDQYTPVIWGGDLNDAPGGSKGPQDWLMQAATAGGFTDGTDRDGSDSARDFASQPITGDTSTQSGSKLDYIMWQDSIATARREFIFRANGMTTVNFPDYAWATYPLTPTAASSRASDQRPVIVDFILPLAPDECAADITGDGNLNNSDINAFVNAFLAMDPAADLNADGNFNNTDINAFVNAFLAGCD